MPKALTGQNILLVWDRLGDYHASRFTALEKRVQSGSVRISDLGQSDAMYQWKNPLHNHHGYHSLSDKPVEVPDLFTRFRNFKELAKKHRIKAAGIAGYGRLEYNLMIVWCRLHGIRVILFAESWYGDSRILNWLKGQYLSVFCSGFLVSGKRAESHFRNKLGIVNRPFRQGYSVVDNDHFSSGKTFKTRKILLCVARFSEEKNLLSLVRAFRKLDFKHDWILKLVGGGPLRKDLEQEAGEDPSIVLSDWLSYAELPDLYGEASFFILPSLFEPWGLVVNEAMAAGLPVAVSSPCGCAPDLCTTSNGFTFDADEASIARVLVKILTTTSDQREAMGAESKRIIQGFSPDTWAREFLALTNDTSLEPKP